MQSALQIAGGRELGMPAAFSRHLGRAASGVGIVPPRKLRKRAEIVEPHVHVQPRSMGSSVVSLHIRGIITAVAEDPIRVSISWNTPLRAINRLLTLDHFRDLVDPSKNVPVHIVRVFARNKSGVPRNVVAVARAQTARVVLRS